MCLFITNRLYNNLKFQNKRRVSICNWLFRTFKSRWHPEHFKYFNLKYIWDSLLCGCKDKEQNVIEDPDLYPVGRCEIVKVNHYDIWGWGWESLAKSSLGGRTPLSGLQIILVNCNTIVNWDGFQWGRNNAGYSLRLKIERISLT